MVRALMERPVIVRLRRGRRLHTVEIEEGERGPRVRIDGRPFEADIVRGADGIYSVLCAGRSLEAAPTLEPDGWTVTSGGRTYRLRSERTAAAGAGAREGSAGPQEVRASLPGKIIEVRVTEGSQVREGDGLVIIEAMKMENELRAPFDARVESLSVGPGRAVDTGAILCVLTPLAEPAEEPEE